MAREGELPKLLAHVSRAAQIPGLASGVVTATACAVSLATNIFEVVSNATLFLLVLYILGNLSLYLLPDSAPDDAFSVPRVVPVLGVATNTLFLVYFLMFEFNSTKFVPIFIGGCSILHMAARLAGGDAKED